MKTIFKILFGSFLFLVPLFAYCQGTPTQGNNTTYYLYTNYLGVGKGFMLPTGDTTWKPTAPAVIYKTSDSTIFYWNNAKWMAISGIISGDTTLNNYLLNKSFIDSLNNNRQLLGYNSSTNKLWLSPPNGDTVTLNSSLVTSVNGKTGNVLLTTDSVSEGSVNLYFTSSRARASILGSSSIGYNNSTGVITANISAQAGNAIKINSDGLYSGLVDSSLSVSSGIIKTISLTNINLAPDTSYLSTKSNVIAQIAALPPDTSVIAGANLTRTTSGATITLTPNNQIAVWNANELQSIGISPNTPTVGQAMVYNGTVWYPTTVGSGSGSVTSVGLTMPSGVFTVTGSPVTSTGNLTATYNSQNAGQVLASPAAASGVPTFRPLTASDIPALSYAPLTGSTNYIWNGTSQQTNSNFNISGNGNIGGNLTVTGSITGSSGYETSDARLKNIIAYGEPMIIDNIKPIVFMWKDGRDSRFHYGYTAQDIKKVIGSAVKTDKNGYMSVNYMEVHTVEIANLYTLIQQQQKEIDMLKKEIKLITIK